MPVSGPAMLCPADTSIATSLWRGQPAIVCKEASGGSSSQAGGGCETWTQTA